MEREVLNAFFVLMLIFGALWLFMETETFKEFSSSYKGNLEPAKIRSQVTLHCNAACPDMVDCRVECQQECFEDIKCAEEFEYNVSRNS